MAETPSRGYGLSRQDMEASRLVFVFLRDARPARKMAVAIPDGATWPDFLAAVRTKLRIAGVAALYLASTGERVERLQQLTDIDEICVVAAAGGASGAASGAASNGATPHSQAAFAGAAASASRGSEIVPAGEQPATPMRATAGSPYRGALDTGASGVGSSYHRPPGAGEKYARRVHPLRRSLQRLFPRFFGPSSLPLTTRDVSDGKGKRGRRGALGARRLLLLLALASGLATILFAFRMFHRALPHQG
jgi:hypothetical protein